MRKRKDLKNIIIRLSDLPIIFGLMITIDCISSFCGLVQDAGPIYGHAVTLHSHSHSAQLWVNVSVIAVIPCIQPSPPLPLYCHSFPQSYSSQKQTSRQPPSPFHYQNHNPVCPHQDKELTTRNISCWKPSLLSCSLCFFYLFRNLFQLDIYSCST